jgi:hypothetical protein
MTVSSATERTAVARSHSQNDQAQGGGKSFAETIARDSPSVRSDPRKPPRVKPLKHTPPPDGSPAVTHHLAQKPWRVLSVGHLLIGVDLSGEPVSETEVMNLAHHDAEAGTRCRIAWQRLQGYPDPRLTALASQCFGTDPMGMTPLEYTHLSGVVGSIATGLTGPHRINLVRSHDIAGLAGYAPQHYGNSSIVNPMSGRLEHTGNMCLSREHLRDFPHDAMRTITHEACHQYAGFGEYGYIDWTYFHAVGGLRYLTNPVARGYELHNPDNVAAFIIMASQG